MEAEYRIPERNMDRLKEGIAKLNKKAARLKLAPIVLTVIGVEDIPSTDDGVEVISRFYNIKLEGQTPKFAGWTFVASLDFVEGGTLVQAVPGLTVPEKYRNAESWCDHCKTRRPRLQTFVLVHESGKYAQVGRNCLANFLGGIDPHALAESATYLIEAANLAEDAEEDGFGGGMRERERIGTLFFLFVTAGAIRTWGWMSRSKVKQMLGSGADLIPAATSERVYARIEDMRKGKNAPGTWREDPRDFWKIEKEDEELASTALSFAKDYFDVNEPDGDYEANLAVICKVSGIEEKHGGLLASLISWYQHKNDLIKQREERANSSNFVGKVGEKLTVTVTVERISDIAGGYGVTRLHRMRDSVGNVLVWFASSECLEEGQTYSLTGRVKAQEEYKGVKQTVLTRCKASPRLD